MRMILLFSALILFPAACKHQEKTDSEINFFSWKKPEKDPVPTPSTSTSFMPQDTIPEKCRNAKVEAYIADWEAGKVDFQTIQPDDTIVPGKACKTYNPLTGGVITLPTCNPKLIPAGWKELSDSPTVIGITLAIQGDHEPHYHSQPECYYVAEGRSRVLAGDKYPWLEKGQYLYVEGDAIHNTPFTESGRFSLIYWFPGNANWDTFNYYYRKNTSHSEEAVAAFDSVDTFRLEHMQLKPYGQNWFDPQFR